MSILQDLCRYIDESDFRFAPSDDFNSLSLSLLRFFSEHPRSREIVRNYLRQDDIYTTFVNTGKINTVALSSESDKPTFLIKSLISTQIFHSVPLKDAVLQIIYLMDEVTNRSLRNTSNNKADSELMSGFSILDVSKSTFTQKEI